MLLGTELYLCTSMPAPGAQREKRWDRTGRSPARSLRPMSGDGRIRFEICSQWGAAARISC